MVKIRRKLFGRMSQRQRTKSRDGDESASFSESSSKQSSDQGSSSRWSLLVPSQDDEDSDIESDGSSSKPTDVVAFAPLIEESRQSSDCDSDSDLGSLSDILGGPYVPPGNESKSDQREDDSPPIQSDRSNPSQRRTAPPDLAEYVSKATRKKNDPVNVERGESDERELEEESSNLETLSTVSSGMTKNGKAASKSKSSVKRVMPKRRSSASESLMQQPLAKDHEGEIVQYGSAVVVIHCETQNSKNRPVASDSVKEECDPIIEMTKPKSGPMKRLQGRLASAVKRTVKPEKVNDEKEVSHFDNLSTCSSSLSEHEEYVSFDDQSDDDDDSDTPDLDDLVLESREERATPLLPPLFESCGCGML